MFVSILFLIYDNFCRLSQSRLLFLHSFMRLLYAVCDLYLYALYMVHTDKVIRMLAKLLSGYLQPILESSFQYSGDDIFLKCH